MTRRRGRPSGAAIAAGVVALAIALVVGAPGPSAATVGERAPSFRLPPVPGGPTEGLFCMSRHLGERPIVVIFWDSLCGYCLKALPVYQKLYERYRPRGLAMVGVSVDREQTISRAGAVARQVGVTFPIVHDAQRKVSRKMNPRGGTPFIVGIDRRGRVAFERAGYAPTEARDVAPKIERLLPGE